MKMGVIDVYIAIKAKRDIAILNLKATKDKNSLVKLAGEIEAYHDVLCLFESSKLLDQ